MLKRIFNAQNLSMRSRIMILVLLATLPMLAVTIYGSWDERVRAIQDGRKEMQNLATLAARQQEQIIEGARQTLIAISLSPSSVRNDKV